MDFNDHSIDSLDFESLLINAKDVIQSHLFPTVRQ